MLPGSLVVRCRKTGLVLDVGRLRRVAVEFARLQASSAFSPQRRGQRFNDIVAEVLRCWGVAAETSVRT
ncbi:MAG TPA: hypothetical protein VFC00_07695, partial [Micromonosporaceae bacterium]|nr:hypothetical protein [Micromonosporaceae bacterium]